MFCFSSVFKICIIFLPSREDIGMLPIYLDFTSFHSLLIVIKILYVARAFRHCKALREYHKTLCMQHVKKVLGHKSILATQRYVDLYNEIYADLKPGDYVCETASTVEEAKKIIEAGFEYVSEIDGVQLYRKVKEKV